MPEFLMNVGAGSIEEMSCPNPSCDGHMVMGVHHGQYARCSKYGNEFGGACWMAIRFKHEGKPGRYWFWEEPKTVAT